MKNIKYILPSLFVTSYAYSANFCSELYNKLTSENYSQSIIQNVYFNYSVFNRPNFGMGVEYKYNVESTPANNGAFNDINEDDLTGNNFNFNSSTSNTTGKLTECNSYGNTATFSIKMLSPGLNLGNQPKQTPTFFINFKLDSSGWQVTSVESSGFVNLYHTHLFNSYKIFEKNNNSSFSNEFYTTALKNMVINDVYPALKNELTSDFNSKIRGFN
jgi:hypothetical protein